MISFNEYKEIPNRYLGSDKKKTILINGERYLLKFPDPIREKGHDISYINNAFSEYIGSKIYQSLDIPTQEVILGTYTEESGKLKIACACKDFCKDGYELSEAEGLMLSMTDDVPAHRAELSEIMKVIDSCEGVTDELRNRFYDMIVVDALICNPDRHNGNWGILVNNEGTVKVAPVYDCGSCFSPVSGDDELSESFAKFTALNTYSAVLDNGKRIFNYEYFKTGKNGELNAAIKRITPKISVDKINSIIDDTPYLSDKRRFYYKQCIKYSYNMIIQPAHKYILEAEHEADEELEI